MIQRHREVAEMPRVESLAQSLAQTRVQKGYICQCAKPLVRAAKILIRSAPLLFFDSRPWNFLCRAQYRPIKADGRPIIKQCFVVPGRSTRRSTSSFRGTCIVMDIDKWWRQS